MRRLIIAWWLSVCVGWLVRKSCLTLFGLGTAINSVDPIRRFEIYSNIEALSRGFQGTVFFLIVGAGILLNVFHEFKKEIDQ